MILKSYHKQAHLTYLKGLKLVHPMSEDENFKIEILIGADHYWGEVEDTVFRGHAIESWKSFIRTIEYRWLYTSIIVSRVHDECFVYPRTGGSKSIKV